MRDSVHRRLRCPGGEQLRRCFPMLARGVQSAQSSVNAREVTVRQDESGSQPQGDLESLRGAFKPAEAREQRAELKMRLGELVTQTHGAQGMFDPGFHPFPALPRQRHAQAVVRFGGFGVQGQGAPEGAFGVRPLASAQVEPGPGRSG